MFNIATTARVCAIALAGFTLVVPSALLAKTQYGPKTTIGNNYQQSSSTTSANGIALSSCNNVKGCSILFQRASLQKAPIIQHVSCLLAPIATELRFGRLRTRKGQTFLVRETLLVPVPTGGAYWVVNTPVMHLLKPGERAVIEFFNSTTTAFGTPLCTISGRLLRP